MKMIKIKLSSNYLFQIMQIFHFLFIFLAFLAVCNAQWAMTDRFGGYRYEIFGKVNDYMSYMEYLQTKASSLALFGWTQVSSNQTIVGEFRGYKQSAEQFIPMLQSCPEGLGEVANVMLRKYDDTRIKYHFTHFRILLDGRETCFEDPPHQCVKADSKANPAQVHTEL